MRIVNTTGVFGLDMDLHESIDRLYRAGFRYIDLGLLYLDYKTPHPFISEDWKAWTQDLKAYADSLGVQFVQCHGVGTSKALYDNPESIAYRAIEIVAILGVKWIVVHPQDPPQYYPPGLWKDEGEFVRLQTKWLRRYLDLCEDRGVGLALENLPWPHSNRAKPLADIVDAMDSENVGVCWDTGHGRIFGLDHNEIRTLGHRLVTIHAHDNSGKGDEHQIPFHGYGTFDWVSFMKMLREIHYKGDFVLEAHHQMRETTDEALWDRYLREMLETSQKLIGIQ